MIVRQIEGYCTDFVALQTRSVRHKVAKSFTEITNCGKAIPEFLTISITQELDLAIKQGIDNLKFELLLKASLREGSLS